MNQYPIEHNIEMPDGGMASNNKYPWKEMAVGDSFFVPVRDGEIPDRVMRRVQPSCCNAGHRLGKHFVIRTVEGGARVWRVE